MKTNRRRAAHRALLSLLLVLSALATPLAGAVEHSAFDLIGNWASTIEFGKFKMNMVVKVTKSDDGHVSGKIDIPDQGAKDIPVSAMLCNFPDLRWEIDPFDNIAFNGRLSADGQEIVGSFDEGPGGRPIAVTFKRLPDSALEKKTLNYTVAAGEPLDVRGYWEAAVADDRSITNRVGLKVGRAADGSFGVLLDMLDRGTVDVSASSATWTNSTFKAEWQLFRITFEGKLNQDASQLEGTWQQRGKSTPAAFARLKAPAKVLPDDLSFVPESNSANDVRGEWKGVLEIPDSQKLRIVLRIGKTPAGFIGGTLASPDQGGSEMPMSSGTFTNNQVRLEWKSINGVYKGSLTNGGTALDGTWEQMGPGLKLRLERTAAANEAKKP